MSVKNAQLFLEKLADDETLQNKLEAIGNDYHGDQNNLRIIVANNIIPTAKALGYDFTIDEYLECVGSAMSEMSETSDEEKLSDDDMDQVVGGISFHLGYNISALYRKGLLPEIIPLKSFTVGTVQNKFLKKTVVFPASNRLA